MQSFFSLQKSIYDYGCGRVGLTRGKKLKNHPKIVVYWYRYFGVVRHVFCARVNVLKGC